MIFEKLEQEEKEAEKLLYTENPEANADAPVTEEVSINEPIATEVVVQPQVQESEEEKLSWKKRFTNFKATTDNTIFQLRKDNASLKSDLAGLEERNETILSELLDIKKNISKQKKEESFNTLFTKEDEELLGSEAIDIFKKAVKKVSNPEDSDELKTLKEEVNKLKKDKINSLKKEKETVELESFEGMKSKLSTIVSDWQDIDTDPKFIAYLEELDDVDLVPRKNLFSSAVQSRSARGVARFYKEYKEQRSPNKEEILSKKITPVGSNASGSEVNLDKDSKEMYPMKDYQKFMDDLTKGKYRGKEKEARLIEAKYDKAYIDGRLY